MGHMACHEPVWQPQLHNCLLSLFHDCFCIVHYVPSLASEQNDNYLTKTYDARIKHILHKQDNCGLRVVGSRAQQLPCGAVSADGQRGPLQCPACGLQQVVFRGSPWRLHPGYQLADCQLHHPCQLLPCLEETGEDVLPCQFPPTTATLACVCNLKMHTASICHSIWRLCFGVSSKACVCNMSARQQNLLFCSITNSANFMSKVKTEQLHES